MLSSLFDVSKISGSQIAVPLRRSASHFWLIFRIWCSSKLPSPMTRVFNPCVANSNTFYPFSDIGFTYAIISGEMRAFPRALYLFFEQEFNIWLSPETFSLFPVCQESTGIKHSLHHLLHFSLQLRSWKGTYVLAL